MRLLQVESDQGFSLVEYSGSNVPPYAILSHTWGEDAAEVTLKDLIEGTGKDKAGYRKLIFCGNEAAKDEIHHFWVDTCCIDKSSSAELSEAINSMFQWYRDAEKCYVYLSDVSVEGFDTPIAKGDGDGDSDGGRANAQQSWDLSFRRSRWFTRGWTLQELVAPACVEFFSTEGVRLGDKDSMVQELHEITGINILALQGSPLSLFSIDERMSWAASRKTKRGEDAAYSLLGLFDIHMPLIYGEGEGKALMRLRKELEYTSNIERLFQRNQEILLDTQRLVLQQQDAVQSGNATAGTQLKITYITMPLMIVLIYCSLPASLQVFRVQPDLRVVIILWLSLLAFIFSGAKLVTLLKERLSLNNIFRVYYNLYRQIFAAFLPQDDLELQRLPSDHEVPLLADGN